MGWMAWTVPTAIFFAAIGLCVLGLTAWEVIRPSMPRRGFLPIATTRGDRFFIGLLVLAFVNLAWLAQTGLSAWLGLVCGLCCMGAIARWG